MKVYSNTIIFLVVCFLLAAGTLLYNPDLHRWIDHGGGWNILISFLHILLVSIVLIAFMKNLTISFKIIEIVIVAIGLYYFILGIFKYTGNTYNNSTIIFKVPSVIIILTVLIAVVRSREKYISKYDEEESGDQIEEEFEDNSEEDNNHAEHNGERKFLTLECSKCGAPIGREHIEVTNKHIIATCPYCETVQYIKD